MRHPPKAVVIGTGARPAGLLALYGASIVGRLPAGAVALVLLLRTREMTGSYAAGGIVAAVNGIALCVASPFLGRRIDRRGQRATLLALGAASAAALAGFAALPDATPLALVSLVAVLAGCTTPPLSACVRAVLSDVVPADGRHRAFALDSTVFELIYIAGPLVLVGIVGAWSLRGAVGACALLTVAGTTAFAATRLSRTWRGRKPGPADIRGPLREAGVRVLIAVVAVLGLGIAGLEVALAAFSEAEGSPNAIGVLLALSGVGSMTGGLLAARGRAPERPERRLTLLLLSLALLEVPLALVHSLPAMAAAMVIGGLAIAPSLALAFQLVGDVAPPGTATEALAWMGSATAAGLAAGAAVAGALVERFGTTVALGSIVAYGLVAMALTAVNAPALTPRAR
ncbi:MAG TPA: MFS transporter [Solirubrobacteraceae bacterium]